MVRMYGRIAISLFACLLMQIGLLGGVSPVQAQAHVVSIVVAHCHDRAETGCNGMRHSIHSPPVHHHEKCCDAHTAAADIPPPSSSPKSLYYPVISRQQFAFHKAAGFIGTDSLPLLPPPKIRTF